MFYSPRGKLHLDVADIVAIIMNAMKQRQNYFYQSSFSTELRKSEILTRENVQ
jgi:hypothetical protein